MEAALASCDGVSVFAYSSLFDSANTALTDQESDTRRERAARRAEWKELLGAIEGSS